jgi:hypothetical protein
MIDRRIEAAKRYAQADRSDPFAYARAMTHISNGIAAHFTGQGKESFYDADKAQETRKLPDGREYQATIYKNVVRP